MDSLRQAVKELGEWRTDHEDILRSIGFCSGLPTLQSRSSKSANSTSADTSSTGAGSHAEGCKGDGKGVTAMNIGGNSPRGEDIVDTGDEGADSKRRGGNITLQHLSACIHAAEKISVGRCLKEVREMRAVLQRANDWIEQCQSLCPRRQSKRRVQPSSKPTFERLKTLIADGLASPVRVSDEVDRIRRHIAEAESCQNSAKSVLDKVCSDLADQTIERREIWRKEDEESREHDDSEEVKSSGHPLAPGGSVGDSSGKQHSDISKDPVQLNAEQAKPKGGEKRTDAGKYDDSTDDDSDGVDREDELDEAEESLQASLEQLLITARDITIFMPEELVVEKVQKIMEWARYVNMLP